MLTKQLIKNVEQIVQKIVLYKTFMVFILKYLTCALKFVKYLMNDVLKICPENYGFMIE